MSCLWVEISECKPAHLYRLTQLLREDEDLQIVLSCQHSHPDNAGRRLPAVRTEKLLAALGMPSHLKGYLYLRTALELCRKDPEELDGITKRLYPDVARKYGTSGDKVEHAIRHAIEAAWRRGNSSEWERLFGKQEKRPTNSEFIARLNDYVGNEINFLS